MRNKKQKQKSLKRRMNRTAILSFYSKRTRRGDIQRIAEETGYSVSHVSNMINGVRKVTDVAANAMYMLTRRHQKNAIAG